MAFYDDLLTTKIILLPYHPLIILYGGNQRCPFSPLLYLWIYLINQFVNEIERNAVTSPGESINIFRCFVLIY